MVAVSEVWLRGFNEFNTLDCKKLHVSDHFICLIWIESYYLLEAVFALNFLENQIGNDRASLDIHDRCRGLSSGSRVSEDGMWIFVDVFCCLAV